MDYGDAMELVGADGWEGDDATLTCPCGHTIEPDAEACPDGCENPMVAGGLI